MLHAALEKQCRRSTIHVNFSRAYWTPPLTPKLAYETERNQIENTLGLNSLISLTDHDTITAPVLLRTLRQTARTPISLEWSVPFAGTIFHLGVHNLPSRQAQSVMNDLASYTRNPCDRRLCELLATLDAFPEVLVVFNHPLWTQTCVGVHRDAQALGMFLNCAVQFLHAFEINATRSTKENNCVAKLAEQWQRPLVSGGDRHGCTASGALNLTHAETFCEFVNEIRLSQRSHVLLMPQYAEPVSIRTTRTLLDVIRNYPENPIGSRRWDDRIFHPSANGSTDQPISSLWNAPPAYVEKILAGVRLLENAMVQRVLERLFRRGRSMDVTREIVALDLPAEEVSGDVVSSEVLT